MMGQFVVVDSLSDNVAIVSPIVGDPHAQMPH